MKHYSLAITFVAVAAFSVGCKPSEEKSGADTSAQFDKVKKETKEASQEMKDYTYAQKTEFVEKMQTQLAEKTWGGLGLRAMSRIVRGNRPWLANLLSKEANLLRAPFIQELILEDWLLAQMP